MDDYNDIEYPINNNNTYYNVDNNNGGCLQAIVIIVIALIVMFCFAMCNQLVSHHPIDSEQQYECR